MMQYANKKLKHLMNYVLKSCKEQSVATVACVCLTEDTFSHDSCLNRAFQYAWRHF